jgi:predicted nucleic acid-binding protein
MTTVVTDNTVLSNFAHVQKPELFQEAFDDLVTAPAVMKELAEGERLGRVPIVDWTWLRIVEMTSEEETQATHLNETLGRGEAECIAIAQSRSWTVLTDDQDARRTAKSISVTVSGTLGALVNLVKRDKLTLVEADKLLAQMKHHGYRSPVNSLSELE